ADRGNEQNRFDAIGDVSGSDCNIGPERIGLRRAGGGDGAGAAARSADGRRAYAANNAALRHAWAGGIIGPRWVISSVATTPQRKETPCWPSSTRSGNSCRPFPGGPGFRSWPLSGG